MNRLISNKDAPLQTIPMLDFNKQYRKDSLQPPQLTVLTVSHTHKSYVYGVCI